MIDVSKMRSELNKLNKETLIDIIMNKTIPNKISVSDNVRKYVKCQFGENTDEFCDDENDNLKMSNEMDQLRCLLKIANCERSSLQRLVRELEKSISNQDLIIELLKRDSFAPDCNRENPSVVAKPTKISSEISGSGNHSLKPARSKTKIENMPKPGTLPGINPDPGSKVASDLERSSAMKRKSVIHGSLTAGPNMSFASAVRRAWLHVGKVSLGTEPKTIEKYLREIFPGNTFTVEPLPRREEASSMSFKVGAELEILEELNKPNIWPKGVSVRRFRFFRQSPESSKCG
ncbi:hypothetical protein WA026_019375 [Henosepilachna vigintioctopunctata]|uniref:Uncharacterized protein n=1 Tax=Henosepilachna vigintioctopunctata TaxID=420089 RepID=A0AAW1UEJ1_9CUCU